MGGQRFVDFGVAASVLADKEVPPPTRYLVSVENPARQ